MNLARIFPGDRGHDIQEEGTKIFLPVGGGCTGNEKVRVLFVICSNFYHFTFQANYLIHRAFQHTTLISVQVSRLSELMFLSICKLSSAPCTTLAVSLSEQMQQHTLCISYYVWFTMRTLQNSTDRQTDTPGVRIAICNFARVFSPILLVRGERLIGRSFRSFCHFRS